MSEVTLASASEKQVWSSKFFKEYVRTTRFMPYMSDADVNKGGIILSRYELQEEAGKTINVPFIGRLKSAGVTGSAVLDGSEEELTNYNMPISIDWRRNAVRVPKSTANKTEINLLNAGRDALVTWEVEKMRDDIIKAMLSAVTDTAGATVNLGDATAANRNAYAAANSDRLLFGKLVSNYSATWATATATLDSTNDLCTAASMSLAKRIAKSADPHIRPFRVADGDGREFFVAFHGSRTFRDLKADATIVAANTDARAREGNGMKDNPIFQDGDIMYDGIIHREVPEIDTIASNSGGTYSLDNAGASGTTDVRPVFLCGGGSVAIAWGQEPTPRSDYLKDFQFRPGVAIEELVGVKKINFNGVQNGMVSCFFAAPADA